VIPAGQTITAASLTVGLWDLDSNQAGNQVGLYQVNGGDVLTSALSTAAEALNGGTGSVNAEYDVFTLALSNFGVLSGGNPTVHLAFQGPGGGLFGPTEFNSGAILFSTLNITTGTTASVPEPGSWALLASVVGVLAGRRILVRHSWRPCRSGSSVARG
jgi:hypothetical protein